VSVVVPSSRVIFRSVSRIAYGMMAVILAGGVGVGVTPLTRSPAVSVKSIALPRSPDYESLAVIDGKPTLTGFFTNATGNFVGCVAATVNPQSLELREIERQAFAAGDSLDDQCDASPGGTDVTLSVVTPGGVLEPGKLKTQVRVVVRAGAQVRTGPVVMIAGEQSDAITAAADGIFWLYDCQTSRGAELLRISDTTGAVEARISMPSVCDATVTADNAGFYIGTNAKQGAGAGALQLYFVGRDASRAETVATAQGWDPHVRALTATQGRQFIDTETMVGQTVYVDVVTNTYTGSYSSDLLWSLTGVAAHLIGSAQGVNMLAGEPGVGLFGEKTVPDTAPRSFNLVAPTYRADVVQIDTASGQQRALATLRPAAGVAEIDQKVWADFPSIVVARGDVFVRMNSIPNFMAARLYQISS
jgi:hypothetical protein